MANALYDKGREAWAKGTIAWTTSGGDTIKATLIDVQKYTVSTSTHQYLTSIGSSARAATATVTSKTNTNGVLGAANTTFSAVPSGTTVTAVVIYKDSGSSATSPLLLYLDRTSTGGTFSVIPNGGDIIAKWSTGANKIAKL